MLSGARNIEFVGDGSTREDALHLISTVQPQVILLDAELPNGNLATLHSLAPHAGGIAIILLLTVVDESRIKKAFQAGARGILRRTVKLHQLIEVVQHVHNGQTYIEPTFASMLLSQKLNKQDANGALLQSLTAREAKILREVTAGQTNKEIARSFDIAEKTVKHHMTNILQKLGARNRVEAALIAREQFLRRDASNNVGLDRLERVGSV